MIQMEELKSILMCDDYFTPDRVDDMIDAVLPFCTDSVGALSVKNVQYIDTVAAFDIETSSFLDDDGEKCAVMYEWTLGICGWCMIGRTWDEFMSVCDRIIERLKITPSHRLIVYIHNEQFEFQFIRERFEWSKVFSLEERKPVYAITTHGIEFRCSYLLSGYKLEKLAENLQTLPIRKLVGDLDYSRIRLPITPLTRQEIDYCLNDVKIVMCDIYERSVNDGGLQHIPMTKTGYVRKFCRANCFQSKEFFDVIHLLNIADADEYDQLQCGFQGGFTHANPFRANKIIYNADSMDFTSSYPATIIAEMYPMSSAELIRLESMDEFEWNLRNYCCLFDVMFSGLESTVLTDSYLSTSRCRAMVGVTEQNGRIRSAQRLVTTLTDPDFDIIRRCYTWDNMQIANFRRYKRGYLPTEFIKSVLELYQQKTQLKGVANMEIDYLHYKEMLNSCYGMMVTNIVRPEILYTGNEWKTDIKNTTAAVAQYNKSTSRFLFYPWGCWVTAYARRNLWSGILACGSDYLYSDTDSIKLTNIENHRDYFDGYNANITARINRALDFHGIDRSAACPKTIKGVEKPIGVWDFDGHYDRFKTLGAKRYMVETDGKYSITVSGLNKTVAVPYMVRYAKEHGIDPFDMFTDGMYIPPEHTGKLLHSYIDVERSGTVTDYLGNTGTYHELSGLHLSPIDYSLGISEDYFRYIKNLSALYD